MLFVIKLTNLVMELVEDEVVWLLNIFKEFTDANTFANTNLLPCEHQTRSLFFCQQNFNIVFWTFKRWLPL